MTMSAPAAGPSPAPHPTPSGTHGPAPPTVRGPISRRALLTAGGAAGLGIALSGCIGQPGAPSGTSPDHPRTEAPRPLRLTDGALLRGANIAVKSSYYPRPWHNLWLRWDWDDWIKWQVDLAATLGVNCIRLIGAVTPVAEGAMTTARYHAQWAQLLDYLTAKGMSAYPCPGDLRHWGATTLPQAVKHYRMLGALFDRYPNVVGIDVSNEAQFGTEDGHGATDVRSVMVALTKALRSSTSTALAHSVSVGSALDLAQPSLGQFAGLSDFLDLHLYYTPSATDLRPLSRQPTGDRPVVIGEFGIGIEEPSSDRTARYLAVRDLIRTDRRLVGALAWDIAEDNFGLFDTSGRPRDDITAALTTFPLHR